MLSFTINVISNENSRLWSFISKSKKVSKVYYKQDVYSFLSSGSLFNDHFQIFMFLEDFLLVTNGFHWGSYFKWNEMKSHKYSIIL